MSLVQYTATKRFIRNTILSPLIASLTLPRNPSRIASICGRLMSIAALTTITFAVWFTYEVNRFAFSIFLQGTILDSALISLYVALLSALIGGAWSQKLIIDFMPDSPWWHVKSSSALACGFIIGAASNIVGDIIVTYFYVVHCITQLHI